MKSIEGIEELKALKGKCHDICIFIHSSPKMTQALREEQEFVDPDEAPVDVVLDVVTRWNSTLLMLKRVRDLRASIESLRFGIKHENKHAAERLTELRLNEDECTLIDQMIEVLTPFENMTQVFSSGSMGIAAAVAPWIVGLLEIDLNDRCKDERPAITTFKTRLRKEIEDRAVLDDVFLMATALHPMYHTFWFFRDRAEEKLGPIKEKLRDELHKIDPTDVQPQQEVHKQTTDPEGSSVRLSGLQTLLKRKREESQKNRSNLYDLSDELN
ncbi:hypothetical protein BGX34_005922, partial [Mortierella sp. NVP85]